MFNKPLTVSFYAVLLTVLVSCGASKLSHQNRLMLQGIDTAQISNVQFPVPTIKKGDLLTVLIYSDNRDVTEIYNQGQTGGSGGTGAAAANNLGPSGRGYLVDENGMIYIHSLGLIKAEGLQKKELKELITDKLSPVLKNPYVTVRYTNSRIMLLGEVAKPGVIEIPEQKVSILDAIGMAGDLTPFGRRDNILIIREDGEKRSIARLDIRSSEIFNSPFFFLQQNDMIYVEPSRKKPTGNDQVLLRNITLATSIISVLAIVASLLLR